MSHDYDYIKGATARIEALLGEGLVGGYLPPLTRLLIDNIIQQAIWHGVDQERERTREWLDDAGKGRGRA